MRKVSSAEYKQNCNRKSCGVPVAIDKSDHDPSSAVTFNETFTYECHSGYNLDGEPDGNRRFKVDPWWSNPGIRELRNTCDKIHMRKHLGETVQ